MKIIQSKYLSLLSLIYLAALTSTFKASAQNPFEAEVDSLLLLLQKAQQDKDVEEQVILYNELGSFHETHGEFDKALAYYLKGVDLSETIGNQSMAAKIYINQSYIYFQMGDYNKMLMLSRAAHKTFKKSPDDLSYSGIALFTMGVAYESINQADSALNVYFEALKIFNETDLPERKSQVLNSIGTIYQSQGKYELALEYYTRSLHIDDSLGYTEYLAIGTANLGGVYTDFGNYQKGTELLIESLEILDTIPNLHFQMTTNRYIAENYASMGDYENAYYYYQTSEMYKDSIFSIETQEKLIKIAEEYESEKKEKEILALKLETQKLASAAKAKNLVITLIIVSLTILIVLLLMYLLYRKYSVARKQMELEQQILRTQMNPHFIFNSLNSVQRMYMEGDFDMANEYMGDFAALLRTILNNSGKNSITLEEELQTLTLYLDIEKMRTDGSLDYQLNVSQELPLKYIQVPPLILQPFVENAIWHGILPSGQKGLLSIEVEPFNTESIRCIIKDNGIGYSNSLKRKNLRNHESKGIKITTERLHNQKAVKIEDAPSGGTIVTVLIPISHD